MRGGSGKLKRPVERAVLTKFVDRIRDDVRLPPQGFKFMTQTLNPNIYKYPAHKQFLIIYPELRSILEYCFSDYCYISEVTDKGNVHIHFWYILKEERIIAEYYDMIKCTKCFGNCYETKLKCEKDADEQVVNCYKYMIKDVEKSYKFIRNIYLSGNKSKTVDVITAPKWLEEHLKALDALEI